MERKEEEKKVDKIEIASCFPSITSAVHVSHGFLILQVKMLKLKGIQEILSEARWLSDFFPP